MQRFRSHFVLWAKTRSRRLLTFGVAVLRRYPRLDALVRSVYHAVPGLGPIVRRLVRPPRDTPAIGPAPARRRPFEPLPVEPDGVVTVEGLYHLSRSL